MGINLITEVMDWAPITLTQREHKVLIVLAEDSPDGALGQVGEHGRENRVNWHSVERPVTLRRARVSRAEMYAVIATLIKKGCLERLTKGGGGHEAKYRIPLLRQEIPDAEASDLRQGNPDADTGELRLGKLDAATGPAPEAASGKPRHSASGKNLSCVWDFQTPIPQSLEIPPADPTSPAELEAHPATPLPSPNPGDDNGSKPSGPDDQQSPVLVPLRSPTTGGNARASAGEPECAADVPLGDDYVGSHRQGAAKAAAGARQ